MKASKYLIVFDIDGTITDTVPTYKASYISAMMDMGVRGDVDTNFNDYLHHTDTYIGRVIYEKVTATSFGQAEVDKLDQLLLDYTTQKPTVEIKGAVAFIEALQRDSRFAIAYATGGMFSPAKRKLEDVKVQFDDSVLVASNQFEERERIVSHAVEQAKHFYNIDKFDGIVALGDGKWDLKTAFNLGIGFLGVGKLHEKLLREMGAAYHIEDFSEISIEDLIPMCK